VSDDEPSFSIPRRPTRRYPGRGGVEYDGGTVFRLTPDRSRDNRSITDLVESILEEPPYRYGDWFDLPMPLYLVHDDDTGDTFRVAIRDGTVRLYVLPETGRSGLRAFYDRLAATDDADWAVECRPD